VPDIYLSVVWGFETGAAVLEGLGLTLRVVVTEALTDVGVIQKLFFQAFEESIKLDLCIATPRLRCLLPILEKIGKPHCLQ
jgi:hypothetical protein